MPTPTQWIGAAFTAGVAGRALMRKPLPDMPRAHLYLFLLCAIIFIPVITYMDAKPQLGLSSESVALETGVILVIAYGIGLAASFMVEKIEHWRIFQE